MRSLGVFLYAFVAGTAWGVGDDNVAKTDVNMMSEEKAAAEKMGVFSVNEPIQIFQASLTSHRMVVSKSPIHNFALNCPKVIARHIMNKEVGSLAKITGERVFPSAYIFEKRWFEGSSVGLKDKRTTQPAATLCKYEKSGDRIDKSLKIPMSMRRLNKLINEEYRINLMLPNGMRAKEIVPTTDLSNPTIVDGKGLAISMSDHEGKVYVRTDWQFVIIRTPLEASEGSNDKTFKILAFYAYPTAPLGGQKTFGDLLKLDSFEMIYAVDVREAPADIEVVSEINGNVNNVAMTFYWIIGIGVVLFLSLTAGAILIRTVFKDIALANKDVGDFLLSDEDKIMEAGWKLVHADVFRAPNNSILLCASIGFGLQIFITGVFSFISGIASLKHFGERTFIMYCFSGIFGGYVSAMFYKSFGGERWKLCVTLTHFFYPIIVLTMMSVANTALWITANDNDGTHDNEGAIPFVSVLIALAMWIVVGFPLTFVGAYFGFKRAPFEYPVRTNLIPRQIPSQTFANKLLPRAFLGGGFVFLAFFLQVVFFNDDLMDYGSSSGAMTRLVVASLLSACVCAEMGLINTYRQLTGENYQWWWQSFITTGSSSLFVFVVLCIIWFDKFVDSTGKHTAGMTSDSVVNGIVFMCMATSFSIIVALMNGFIGFIASWFFVRKLYGAVRVD